MLVAIRDAGLWPTYEAWKRDITGIVEEEGRRLGRPPLPLWDFSGFNSVTSETIPAYGVTSPQMRYWWEPSHYQSLVGAMMLDRILGHVEFGRDVPGDFGVRLDSATIDGIIDQTRRGALAYAAAHPDEIGIVTEAVDHLMEGQEGADCGEDVQALYDGLKLRSAGDPAAAEAAFERGKAIHEAQRRLYAEIDAPFREAGFYPLLDRVRAGERIYPPLATADEYEARARSRMSAGDRDGALRDVAVGLTLEPGKRTLVQLRDEAQSVFASAGIH
jgi:hypothetical protein